MAPERWLFWHRRDLRLADNLGLAAAAASTPAVTGVFVLDPSILADPLMEFHLKTHASTWVYAQ